jgi:hypothetical protein
MKIFKTLLALSMIASCGAPEESESSKNINDESAYANYVPKDDEEEVQIFYSLPRCTVARSEKVIYIPEEELFMTCKEKDGKAQWQILDLNTTSECPVTEETKTDSDTE